MESYNEIESEKQQSKKRKITEDDDRALKKMINSSNADTSCHLPLKIMYSVKEEIKKQGETTEEEIETILIDDTNICDRGNEIDGDVVRVRATTTKNSHLPLKIMYSVKEDKRKELERIGEIETNTIDDKYIIVWKNKIEGDVIGTTRSLYTKNSQVQMDIMCSVIEEEKRREIQRIRAVDRVFWKNLRSYAGYDGKNDRRKTDEEAEGTGSSCSPEILHREEVGDNFTMKTMGVREGGDAFSCNSDEVIRESEVSCCHNRCRPRKSKEYECSVKRVPLKGVSSSYINININNIAADCCR